MRKEKYAEIDSSETYYKKQKTPVRACETSAIYITAAEGEYDQK